MKKKVLYVITKSVWGGAGRYVFDLATKLPKDRFESAVALGGTGRLYEKLREENVQTFQIKNFQYRINFFKEIFAFFELLRLYFKWKPDIIHTNSSKAGGLGATAARLYNVLRFMFPASTDESVRRASRCKIVFTAHGWAFHETRAWWIKFIMKALSELTVLLHNKVICVSQFDYNSAKRQFVAPKRKLVMIHNGIDTYKLDTQFLSKQEAQQKLFGNPQNKPAIGTIGEWIANKGWKFLVDAFTKLTQEGHEFSFIMIGGGENRDKEKLTAYIRKNNLEHRVTLHEFISDAAVYLKAFDVFVLPSLKEGFPFVILEAAAAEVPIIATRVGGVPEFIENQKTGLLVEPGKWLPISENIKKLIQRPELRNTLTKNARDLLEREFTFEKTLRKTVNLYDSII